MGEIAPTRRTIIWQVPKWNRAKFPNGERRANVSAWERERIECMEYTCDNESGAVRKSKCKIEDDEICEYYKYDFDEIYDPERINNLEDLFDVYECELDDLGIKNPEEYDTDDE